MALRPPIQTPASNAAPMPTAKAPAARPAPMPTSKAPVARPSVGGNPLMQKPTGKLPPGAVYKAGGKTASARADGIASRGKTKCKMY
jgi:hypothetical protein